MCLLLVRVRYFYTFTMFVIKDITIHSNRDIGNQGDHWYSNELIVSDQVSQLGLIAV